MIPTSTLAAEAVSEGYVPTGASSAPDTASGGYLTVLTARAPMLAKRWQPDGTITSQAQALQFTCTVKPVTSIHALAEHLGVLSPDACSAVVRGLYVGDEVAAALLPEMVKADRAQGKTTTLRSGQVLRRGRLFRDRACHWLMLDVDAYVPKVDPILDPQGACLEFIHTCLRPAFHGVTFYFALSGSAGAPKHAGKLKAHLWFWLATPRTCAELRGWAHSVPQVDASIFNPVQLHYTAAPMFSRGVVDPVPVRAGLVVMESDSVHGLEVPVASTLPADVLPTGDRRPMPDPTAKPGIVGSFCRVVGPGDLCDLLPGEFEPGRDKRHFSWLGHDAADGVFITDCGHGLVSVHATAPTGQNRRCNIFDFVRLHQFGHLDEAIDDTVPATWRPSWAAMLDWIRKEVPEAIEELDEVAASEHAGHLQPPVGKGALVADAESVIQHLRTLTREHVAAQWTGLTKHLPPSQCTRVINEVKHLLGESHVRPLRSELKEVQERERSDEDASVLAARVGERQVIQYRPEDRAETAHAIEAAVIARLPMEEYLQFGGQLSRLGVNTLPNTSAVDDSDAKAPDVPLIEPLNDVNVLELAEKVVVLQTWRDDRPVLIGIPAQVIKIMQNKARHACPAVSGLVSHPLVLPTGEIASRNGLHAATGLYFAGAAISGLRPYDEGEARLALARLRDTLLLDFAFASDLDRDAAIAALLTGLQRRVMDIAPGVAIVAPGQSSGKTTLARRIHLMLTGHDMPVMPFPDGNEEEVSKQLLATLMCSPAAVCFDNLLDGTTFRSGNISAAMTSPQYKKRILGESRVVTCPTNVLFMLTGNNVTLGADEATRWITIHLTPATARPDQRTFKQPDVVAHALSIRSEVLLDAVGIVAGYLLSGVAIQERSRFPQWDRYVRQPLIWAGASDVAEVFSVNIEQGEEVRAYQGLVRLLHEAFGWSSFSASKVAHMANSGPGSPDFPDQDDIDGLDGHGAAREPGLDCKERLRELLGNLRAKDVTSASSVGRVLKAACGRPATLPGDILVRLARHSRDGCSVYQVEVM